MLIGEAPGNMENAKKIPFVGPSGRNLNKYLQGADINPREVYVTNVIKYWPQDPPGKTRTPTDEELRAFKPYLIEEISSINPKFIGLMGLSAIKVFIPDAENVYEINGQVLQYGGFNVVPLYHPGATLYQMPSHRRQQVRDGYLRLGMMYNESIDHKLHRN
jgi:DNA polymerase